MAMPPQLLSQPLKAQPWVLHHSVALNRFHTFGLHSTAAVVVHLTTLNHLHTLSDLSDSGQPWMLMGEGSNTVFVTPFYPGTVVRMGLRGHAYLGIDQGCHMFRVMAGENWHNWVEWTVAQGLGGLENLALIPGTVGASPVQNIGAYGVEVCERLRAVHVWNLRLRQLEVLSREDCAFAYRDSVFKGSLAHTHVIVAVDFALPVVWTPVLGYGDVQAQVQQALEQEGLAQPQPRQVMNVVVDIRTRKLPDPVCLGNAGSFFKNPLVPQAEYQRLLAEYPTMPSYPAGQGLRKLAAGWLIEQCGLKGQRWGGVGVYAQQALILVNHGSGEASDLLTAIQNVCAAVQAKFGVQLEPEPLLVGKP